MVLRDTAARLAELEQILGATAGTRTSGEPDAVDVHLHSVPVERIRRLTAVLAERESDDPDAIDTIAMRLLLNEYTAAVSHLRAVAVVAAGRVDGASAPVRDARRAMHRLTKATAPAEPESPANELP